MKHDEADARLYRVDRWREEDLDIPLWHERTTFMIRLLRDYLSARGELGNRLRLLELGCGAMAAERVLASEGLEQIEYIPSDVFPRDPRTLVIDLEDPGFVDLIPRVDVILVAGVLEYLSDPRGVLDKLAGQCRYLFYCYCPRADGQDDSERRGWKNHLTEGEMEAIARSIGVEIEVDAGFDCRAPKPVRTYFVPTRAAGCAALGAFEARRDAPPAGHHEQPGRFGAPSRRDASSPVGRAGSLVPET